MDKNFSSKRYEPPFIDLNNKNNSHTLIIEYTGYNKKVLEIGTSTGNVTKILQEHQNEIVGIEIDPEAAQLAEKYCSRMIIGDIEKIDLDLLFDSSSFDVIICGDVLEHLINPLLTIQKIKKLLKKKGYLVVSIPNFCHGDVILNIINGDFCYTDKGLLDKTHLRFFGLKNIYTLFSDAGYQISDLSSTHVEIGETEIKLRTEKIPDQLIRFIQSLPETSTYQYIFTAYPSENPSSPLIDEREFGKIFTGALEGTLKNYALKRSSTFQVTTKIHRTLVQPLFPLTTRRRRYYNLVLDGGRILVNEGPGMFFLAVKRYLNRNHKIKQ